MLTLGTVYCWGNFISYLPPSMQYFDPSTATGAKDSLLSIPICMTMQFIGMLFAPALQKKVGIANAMMVGSAMQAFGTYMGSLQTALAPFLFWYSCFFGTGIGLAYTAPLVLGFKRFPGE